MNSDKVLIVTALSLEFHEVEKFMDHTDDIKHPQGIVYKKGIYTTSDNFEYEILLAETGAGNLRAADETSRAIEFFDPDFAIFVGVAGGIKDVNIGDVVVSSKVIGFETGKADEEFKPRFNTINGSYLLEQTARHVSREKNWREKLKSSNETIPEVFIAPIAAGEKVISSKKSSVFQFLRQHCSDAIAVDMEGSGFLLATRPFQIHGIEVRGISDLIDGKSKADASGSQPRAAKNAATFTFQLIEKISRDRDITQLTKDQQFKNRLVDKLLELYEEGPKQDSIWKRSGGDVSIFSNSSSRKTQWYNAIDKLSKGGGGQITFKSLIDQVNADYPNSDFVESIFK